MAIRSVLAASFLFAMVLSSCLELSTCLLVEGKVSCLDCNKNFDFSGIRVLVKCDQTKKSVAATTDKDGIFSVNIIIPKQTPLNCLAKLLGGEEQLYASRQDTTSKIIKTYDHEHEPNSSYTISSPLAFSITCPPTLASQGKCEARDDTGESKTIDLPVPPEWGLAPTSYYIPFIPIIIGIP